MTTTDPTTAPESSAAAGDRRAQFAVLSSLRRDLPGPATDDRFTQASHFTGTVYLAIRRLYEAMSAATVTVTARNPRKASAAGGGRPNPLRKAVNAGDASDADYVPAPFDHPLCELFRTINSIDTLADFLTDWVIQESLFGSAPIWTPAMAGYDKPAELWVLPVPFLTPTGVSSDNPEGTWVLSQVMPSAFGMIPTSGSCRIDGREIVRSRHRHPLYRWDGLSTLTAYASEIDALRAVNGARKAAMDNEIDPSMILAVEGGGFDAIPNAVNAITNRHSGAQNRKRVIGIDAKSASVSFPTRTAKDMDYGTGYEQLVKAVLAVFGVPPTVAGLTEASSYAALYAAKQQFYDSTISTMCRRYSAFLTKHVAAKHYGDRYRVTIAVPPPSDENRMDAQISADVASGVRTMNEARALRNEEPYPDGDVPKFEFEARRNAKVQADTAPPEAPPGGDSPAGGDGGEGATPKPEPKTPPGLPPAPTPGAQSEGSLPPSGPLAKAIDLADAEAFADALIDALGA